MPKLKQKIYEALKSVHDPELGISVVDLGLIYGVEVIDGSAFIKMTMTSPFCPVAGMITEGVKNSVESIEGVARCEIEITFDPPWTPEKMSDEAKEQLGILGAI